MRSIVKTYSYMCDHCGEVEEVHTGDAIPAHTGALYPYLAGTVRDSKGADITLRRRHRWKIGSGGTFHLCSECKDK